MSVAAQFTCTVIEGGAFETSATVSRKREKSFVNASPRKSGRSLVSARGVPTFRFGSVTTGTEKIVPSSPPYRSSVPVEDQPGKPPPEVETWYLRSGVGNPWI